MLPDHLASGDSVGPAYQHRRADAAFVGGALAALHAAVPARPVGAVVAKVDNDRVVGDAHVVQLVEQTADIPINVLAHGQSRADVAEVLLLGFAVAHLELEVLELVPPAIGNLHRGMRGVVGEVAEERFARLDRIGHELHRLVGEVVDAEAFALHEPAVVFQRRAEVVAPVAGAEAVILVKAAPVRVVGILHPVVPLAEGPGPVSARLEGVADGRLIQVESFTACGGAVDASAGMVTARQELRAGGGADGADVESIEHRAIAGE